MKLKHAEKGLCEADSLKDFCVSGRMRIALYPVLTTRYDLKPDVILHHSTDKEDILKITLLFFLLLIFTHSNNKNWIKLTQVIVLSFFVYYN